MKVEGQLLLVQPRTTAKGREFVVLTLLASDGVLSVWVSDLSIFSAAQKMVGRRVSISLPAPAKPVFASRVALEAL